jgi:hypothetical protein
VDEWEIQKLVHRYAVALDKSDFEDWARLFTEDVHWQTVGRPAFSGLPEVMDVPKRLHAAYPTTFHSVLTQTCQIAGDLAQGITYCIAYHMFEQNFVVKGRDPVDLSYKYLIRYDDTFRKTGGVWKFSARRLTMVSRQIDQIIRFDEAPPELG